MRICKIQKGMNDPNTFPKQCTNEFKQFLSFSSTSLSINYEYNYKNYKYYTY